MNEPVDNIQQVDEESLPPKPRRSGRGVIWLTLLLITVVLVADFIRHHRGRTPQNQKSPVVSLGMVSNKNIPVYIDALGNVTAVYTVTVKTQINGLLMSVLYKEGQMVKKGDLLVEIDQRPLLAQLKQYEGQLVRDQALLENALVDLKRYQQLWKQDSISQQTLATQASLVRQYQGSIDIDLGLIESTKVNLIYTRIISPIDGRIGLRLVDPGNFVQTSDTNGLAVITSMDPITVIFSIPEDDVPKLLPQVFAGKPVTVEAYDRLQNQLMATGTLLTMDNQIDNTTGTVRLRAQFNNKNNVLFPNQFVNIRVLVDQLNNATVVPTNAIQHGTQGNFVFVYNPNDSTVNVQTIKTGLASGDDTVINDVLKAGQQVVTEGSDKLRNGSKVKLSKLPLKRTT